MNVTLTQEQFEQLLRNANSNTNSVKKFDKNDLNDRTEAINLEQFMSDFEFLSITKLSVLEPYEYVLKSIMDNVSNLEEDEMPFICSNYKTKSFYYKKNDTWCKGTEFIKKINSLVTQNAFKQLCQFGKDIHSVEHDEKQLIILKLCDVDNSKQIEKITSKLAKELKHYK
jgi:hypothetical protein